MSSLPESAQQPRVASRQCCAWSIVAALVLLRLAVGWHFFNAGLEKVSYDRSTGEWEVKVPTEPFLNAAKGPLAPYMQSQLPGHMWRAKLAVAEELTPESGEKLTSWVTGYVKRRQGELASGKSSEVSIPEFVPFAAWYAQIDADRRAVHERFTKLNGLTEEQRAQAAAVFEHRQNQLADYLAGEALDMQAYRHELWRLSNMEDAAGADEVPFQEARVAQKQLDVTRTPQKWVATVRQFDDEFAQELVGLLTSEQRAGVMSAAADVAVTDPSVARLRRINIVVACLTLGVGLLLMLGLFTRFACLVGALFLLSVMVTQPPWVAGANTEFFYYQLVELAALLLLAVTAAGTFAGLDFFLCRLWSKCCGKRGV